MCRIWPSRPRRGHDYTLGDQHVAISTAAERSARVVAEIENQSADLLVAESLQGCAKVGRGAFFALLRVDEPGDADIADPPIPLGSKSSSGRLAPRDCLYGVFVDDLADNGKFDRLGRPGCRRSA